MADQKSFTSKSDIGQKCVAVVMVPLPAQGHLYQLLHLSRLISLYNIPIHYVGTPAHNRQAKLRVHGFDPLNNNIQFHEFPTPSFKTPPPNPNASHKFPSHLLPSFYATFHLREPICSLVRELMNTTSANSLVVIYDFVMSWVVQDLATIQNVECYTFNCTSAFQTYSHFWEERGKPAQPGTELYEDTLSIENCLTVEFLEFYKIHETFAGKISCGELYNSSRIIEGLYLDLVAKEFDGLNQWAIGPFNPLELKENSCRHASLDWLDNQEPNSVIFVSFGTTTSLCDEEIHELAIGLEKSHQKFIWVLRDADKGDVSEGCKRVLELSEGYEERIKGIGIIVRDWAPQLEILAHCSTGGFMSHCG